MYPNLFHSVPLAAIGSQTAAKPPAAGRTGPHWENLVYLGGIIVGVIVAILLLRAAIRISRWFFLAAFIVFGGIWATNALYNRTEPAWLTPLFNTLSEWLPTKDYQRADPATSAAGGATVAPPPEGAPKKSGAQAPKKTEPQKK